jgi:hypothetical protein
MNQVTQDYGTGQKAKEIIMAGGNLEVATLVATGDVTGAAFTGLGYTASDTGGVLTDKPPTFKEVKVTGQNDPVKRKAGDRDVQFKVVLSQATAKNLMYASGGADADWNVAGYFLGGKSQDAPLRTWRYTVQNDDDNTQDQRVYIPAGRVVDAVEVKYADGDAVGLALTIKAYEVTGAVTLGAAGPSLIGFRYAMQAGSF